MGILDSQEMDIPCPKCGTKTKKSLGWIKTNDQFTCSCGTVINLDADQLRETIAETERAVAGLPALIAEAFNKGFNKGK